MSRMSDLTWIIPTAGFFFTIAITLFAAGRWVGASEERMKLKIREDITESEKSFRETLESARHGFDETLKGLRQKINDVENDALKNYLSKNDWNEFRKEFREDMQNILTKLDHLQQARQ